MIVLVLFLGEVVIADDFVADVEITQLACGKVGTGGTGTLAFTG
jgi:hypothetical protein